MKTGRSLGSVQVAIVTGFLVLSVINPHDRFTWLLEVSWVLAGLVLVLWLSARKTVPSTVLSWALVIHAVILIYGAWYTYELVPLGEWASSVFGWGRNHYDRLGHLAQGFFPAILVREVLIRNQVVRGRYWREGIVLACVMAFAGVFEIIEFAAAKAFGESANAYLGSQGDVWDAQWDMVMCGLGGMVSIFALSKWHAAILKKRV